MKSINRKKMKKSLITLNKINIFIGDFKSKWDDIPFSIHRKFYVDGLPPNKQIKDTYDNLKCIGNNISCIYTNSPFVLYAINNCILGGNIKDTYKGEELPSQKAWINPKNVSIWQIEDGKFSCVQTEDGTIRKNILTDAMDNLMNEFQEILKYFK